MRDRGAREPVEWGVAMRCRRGEATSGDLAVVTVLDGRLLFGATTVPLSTPNLILAQFLAYDPNDPGTPVSLYFDRTTQSFSVPPLTYSPPGRVRAFRLYTSPLF